MPNSCEHCPAWVAADLARSGIPDTEAHRLGCNIVQPGQYHAILGFEPAEAVEGYTINFLDPATQRPLLTPDGRPFVRVKLQRAITMSDGKTAKYLSPINGGQQPFLQPEVPTFFKSRKAVLLTEGEKKAVKATLATFPTIGLVGPDGWIDAGARQILQALEPFTEAGTTWFVILDSDAAWNQGFAEAMARLRKHLAVRSCELRVMVIPHGLEIPNQAGLNVPSVPKIGLDDWIIQKGDVAVGDLLTKATDPGGTPETIAAQWMEAALSRGTVALGYRHALACALLDKMLFDRVSQKQRRDILRIVNRHQPELHEAIQKELTARLTAEFSHVSPIADGGTGLVHGNWVVAPCQEDPVKIAGLDDDIAYVSGVAGTVTRPYFRNHLTGTTRPSASAENGALGGRPRSTSPSQVSDLFTNRHRDPTTGLPLHRFYRGEWYLYNGRYYKVVPVSDFTASVTTFMRKHPDCCDLVKRAFIEDVLINLRAYNACGIPTTVVTPCVLSTKDLPTPAPGWITLRNESINLPNLCEVLRDPQKALPDDQLKRPHCASLFGASYHDYDFDPKARCPRFDAAIQRLLPDEDVRGSLQMLFGLCLIPETKYNVFWVLWGPAGTGKSTILRILRALVGGGNVCAVSLGHLVQKHSIGDLTEKLVNIVGDGDTDTPLCVSLAQIEGILKQVTDGGLIRVERKFHDPHDANATARCIFATNHMPHFVDRSEGLWDRLRVIPFERVIRGTADQDPDFAKKVIADELPGVFIWALQGLSRLLALPRFPESHRGKQVKEEHRLNCDYEQAFLLEMVEKGDKAAFVCHDELYQKYKSWTTHNSGKPVRNTKFNSRVPEVFPGTTTTRKRTNNGHTHVWVGIRWKDEEP